MTNALGSLFATCPFVIALVLIDCALAQDQEITYAHMIFGKSSYDRIFDEFDQYTILFRRHILEESRTSGENIDAVAFEHKLDDFLRRSRKRVGEIFEQKTEEVLNEFFVNGMKHITHEQLHRSIYSVVLYDYDSLPQEPQEEAFAELGYDFLSIRFYVERLVFRVLCEYWHKTEDAGPLMQYLTKCANYQWLFSRSGGVIWLWNELDYLENYEPHIVDQFVELHQTAMRRELFRYERYVDEDGVPDKQGRELLVLMAEVNAMIYNKVESRFHRQMIRNNLLLMDALVDEHVVVDGNPLRQELLGALGEVSELKEILQSD